MILQANAFKIPLDDKSVHCAVTSQPYYSLRKYAGKQEFVFGGDRNCMHEWGNRIAGKSQSGSLEGSTLDGSPAGEERRPKWESSFCRLCNAWRGAYGLEPTLQMYIDHTVEWCREVHRVLRDDGTFWLNMGDSYAGSGGAGGDYNEGGLKAGQLRYPGTGKTMRPSFRRDKSPVPKQQGSGAGLKPKDLMGVPWRVALALQADGWYLRSDIIWYKTNPMPESVTDRPTKSHEYLFLLTKSKTYYYDADAIREGYSESRPWGKIGNVEKDYHGGALNNRFDYSGTGRNKRTVWTIPTAPYSGAHFATFPPALVEPCIKAGTSDKGVCPECRGPWERVVEKTTSFESGSGKAGTKAEDIHGKWDGKQYGKNILLGPVVSSQTFGWRPTCSHYDEQYRAEFPQARSARKRHQQDMAGYWWKRVRQRPGKDHWKVLPATVLDPFSGAATTLLVARKLGRRGIGLDISIEYLNLAKERLGLKALEEWQNGKPAVELDYEGLTLFEGIKQ